MTLRCLFSHRLCLVEYGSIGLLGCHACGFVSEVWVPLRPEIQLKGQRERAAFWARQDQRETKRSNVVRMKAR